MSENFDFPHVVVSESDYRKESVAAYRGNPFIEALPALPSDEQLEAALTYLPSFDPRSRSLPAEVRIQSLDILQKLFVPLKRHVRLARAMLKMVRTGYGPRTPYSKSDNENMQRLYKLQMTGSFVSVRQTALAAQHSMALLGSSGSGKSFSLRHIAGLFVPALYHERFGKWQLPFLFVEMSYDGESVHSLASGVFAELDRLLPGENYTHIYMEKKRFNAQQRLAKALAIAYAHAVGMIIVDEQQNQRSIGNDEENRRVKRPDAATNLPRNETPLAKLLITASNTSHVPLLMAGTLEMKNVVGARFTRGRRMSGRGSAVWHPLDPSFDLADDKLGEFELLLLALWQYQWVKKPVELDDNWLLLFWDLTQGIPDIMVKLFHSSQEAAIAFGTERLTPALVREVFAREFATASFGITALAKDDSVALAAVPDLHNKDLPRKKVKRPVSKEAGGASAVPPGDAASKAKPVPAKPARPSPRPIEMPMEALKGADLRDAMLRGVAPVGATKRGGRSE